MSIKIIEFKPEYTSQVVDLISRMLRSLEVIPQSVQSVDDEDLFKIIEIYKDKGRFWIAIENKKVIGTVAIRDMGNSVAKLNRMFVLFDYHGSGVGQALFNRVIEFAKSQAYKEIILNTHLLMKRAHRFYEKNGFVKISESEDKYHYRLEL